MQSWDHSPLSLAPEGSRDLPLLPVMASRLSLGLHSGSPSSWKFFPVSFSSSPSGLFPWGGGEHPCLHPPAVHCSNGQSFVPLGLPWPPSGSRGRPGVLSTCSLEPHQVMSCSFQAQDISRELRHSLGYSHRAMALSTEPQDGSLLRR